MAATAEVGRTEFGIYANRKPFDKTMNGLQAQAESIGKSISRKLAAGLSAAGVAKFASDCLYQGSKLNAMRSMSSRAFEGMTDDLNKFAQSAAGNFGLSEKMALQFAGTFGTMANSFGFTKKQAYDMSTSLTGLAGDVASFYSMSQEEAFNKLQSVFTGETESLKSLGIVMSQNALDQYALANGFGKTTSQMSEQEKVALRYQFVLSQLSLAQGDFMRTSDAWGNQVKILKLNFQSLQAQIGIGLINVLKPAIKALNVFMTKLVQCASVFAQFTQTIFGKKAQTGTKQLAANTADVGMAAGSAGTGLGSLGKSAGKAAKNTTKAAKALKKAQRDMMGFDKMNKLSKKEIATAGSGGSGGSAKVGDVGGGVSTMDFGGMDDGMEENSTKALKLGKAWDALRKACGRLKKAFGGFWDLMKSAGSWVLKNILKPLAKWTIKKLAPKLVDILAAAFRVLTKVLEALEPVWKTLWKVFFKPLAKFTGKLIIKALELIAKALNKIADFAEKHPKAFQRIVVALLGLMAIKKVSPLLGLLTGKFKLFSRAIQVFGKGKALSGIGKLGAVLFKRTKVFKKFASVAMKFKKIGSIVAKCFRLIGAAVAANPIVAILTAIAIAAVLIWKNWDKIKKTKFGKFLIAVGKVLKQVGITILKAVINKFKAFVARIKLAITVIKKIAAFISGKLKKALKAVTHPLETLKDLWGGIKSKTVELKAKAAEKIEDVEEFLGGIGDTVSVKVSAIKDATFDAVASAWETITDKAATIKAYAEDKLGKAGAAIKDAWSTIENKKGTLTAKLSSKIKTGKDAAIRVLKGAWSAIKDKAATLKASLSGVKAKALETIRSKWAAIKDKGAQLKTSIAGAGRKAIERLANSWNKIKNKTAKLKLAFVDKLKKGYNIIAEKIQRARTKWPATRIILPNIHPLAQGGWLEKNTPRLAVVGDNRHHGEIVSPDDKLEAMANKAAQGARGGSDAQVVALLTQILAVVTGIDTNVYLDGKAITKNTIKNINQQTKTTGRSPLMV